MKKTISTASVVFVSAVLVLFGIFYGAYHGWTNEYRQVTAVYEAENGLEKELIYLGNTAANLKPVALRHITKDDSDLTKVQNHRLELMDANKNLHERYLASVALNDSMDKLIQRLRAIETVQGTRDMTYLDMIDAERANLIKGSAEEYNQAARTYNSMLSTSPTGLIARLMGVKYASVFE